MPRFFFHRSDGYLEEDKVGEELKDAIEARLRAVILTGETLQDDPARVWVGEEFRIEVTDIEGNLVLTVVTLSIDGDIMKRSLSTSNLAT